MLPARLAEEVVVAPQVAVAVARVLIGRAQGLPAARAGLQELREDVLHISVQQLVAAGVAPVSAEVQRAHIAAAQRLERRRVGVIELRAHQVEAGRGQLALIVQPAPAGGRVAHGGLHQLEIGRVAPGHVVKERREPLRGRLHVRRAPQRAVDERHALRARDARAAGERQCGGLPARQRGEDGHGLAQRRRLVRAHIAPGVSAQEAQRAQRGERAAVFAALRRVGKELAELQRAVGAVDELRQLPARQQLVGAELPAGVDIGAVQRARPLRHGDGAQLRAGGRAPGVRRRGGRARRQQREAERGEAERRAAQRALTRHS